MESLRDAFERLVEIEGKSEDELKSVIQQGTFGGEGDPSGSKVVAAYGSGPGLSRSNVRQLKELESECQRLREQLALAQQQLAKAAVSLAASKGKDDKYTLRGNKQKRQSADSSGGRWGKKKDDLSSVSTTPVEDGHSDLPSELLISTTAQLEAERARAVKLESSLRQMKGFSLLLSLCFLIFFFFSKM